MQPDLVAYIGALLDKSSRCSESVVCHTDVTLHVGGVLEAAPRALEPEPLPDPHPIQVSRHPALWIHLNKGFPWLQERKEGLVAHQNQIDAT